MPLFTGAYANPLASSAHLSMQAALDTTRQALSLAGAPNVDNLAMTVVALTGFERTLNHPWAALRQHEVHYAASMVKIAAMYAAFDLRSSADQLAIARGLTTWAQIEAALVSTFNPEIDVHTPGPIATSPTLGPHDKRRKPSYSALLQRRSGSDFIVDFTPAQWAAFEDMMVQQHNAGAGVTIHALGYPYLDGKLTDDGFFDGVSNGIWLAGDYVQQWPYARIACVNDRDTAQGTTTWQLASLLTLLADDQLVGPVSSRGMKDLMARAGTFFHSTSPPIWPVGGRFTATHGKVGIGPLKSGRTVFSESTIVTDKLRGISFVAVWQNVIQGAQTQRQLLEPVATLVEAAINGCV